MSYKKAYEVLLEGVKLATDSTYTVGHRMRELNKKLKEANELAEKAKRPKETKDAAQTE